MVSKLFSTGFRAIHTGSHIAAPTSALMRSKVTQIVEQSNLSAIAAIRNEKNAEVHFNKGLDLLDAIDYKGAHQAFRRALALDSSKNYEHFVNIAEMGMNNSSFPTH